MNKEKIIEYLYGEMDEREKGEFEKQIQSDDQLLQEIQSLKEIRGILGSSKDVVAKPVLISVKKPIRLFHRRWWAIAASICLILLTGKILNLQIEAQEGQFMIAFGTPKVLPNQQINQAELIALRSNLESINNELARLTSTHNTPFTPVQISNPEWDKISTKLEEQLKVNQKDLRRILLEEQYGYFTASTQQLIDLIQQQRQDDLDLINANLVNLARMIQSGNGSDLAQFVNDKLENY